jgi:tetratricopeptide (TPR) repeat protein
MTIPARAVRALLPALVCALLAAGCASSRGASLSRSELAAIAASRGVPAGRVELPFAADDGMREWLREQQEAGRVQGSGPIENRLSSLLEALLGSDGLGLRYQAGFTGTAAEAFQTRAANCLSFTQIFVALARELGADVFFLAVDDVESYRRQGDLVLLAGHVTAGFGPFHDLRVLDFTLGPEVDYYRVRPVPDLTAVGMYYSNRGAEQLAAGRLEEATATLGIATALAPELASGWINLGVALRRNGDSAGAEAAYLRALEADPRATSAYQNLAALVRLRGRAGEAEELLRLAAAAGTRNPYSYLELGDLNLGLGRPAEARRFYQRALALDREHAAPYAALGLAALAEGDRREAGRWLRRARRVGEAEEPRVLLLAGRLDADGGES